MKSGSPIGDHIELWQGGRTVQRGLDADGDVRGYLRGNHDPEPQSSRIGVNGGGEEPQKGTALSRERMPLPRWSETLECIGQADSGETLGGPVGQAHERRHGEGRAIREVGKTLEREKPRRASRDPVG